MDIGFPYGKQHELVLWIAQFGNNQKTEIFWKYLTIIYYRVINWLLHIDWQCTNISLIHDIEQYLTLPSIFHMDSIWNGWIPTPFHGVHMEWCIKYDKIQTLTMEYTWNGMEWSWNPHGVFHMDSMDSIPYSMDSIPYSMASMDSMDSRWNGVFIPHFQLEVMWLNLHLLRPYTNPKNSLWYVDLNRDDWNVFIRTT